MKRRTMKRVVGVAVLLAFSFALAGCEDFDADKLDVFHLNEKKKLPGERKDIFPGGVPGVSEGVPPELVKGYQAPPETATALPGENPAAKKAAAIEPQDEPKPKKTASKPKPHVAKRAPARITVKHAEKPSTVRPPAQQTEASGAQGSRAAQNAQPQATGTNAPWPSSSPQATGTSSPWPSTGAQQPSPWPSAPPPGTFSR